MPLRKQLSFNEVNKMPHITLKCYKGRTHDELQSAADIIAAAAAEALNVKLSSVSIKIEEIDKENWSKVYKEDIYGEPEKLYVKPGYTMDD